MNRTEILLTILSEECNETGQRACKALRFTLNEKQEGQDLTNAERLIYEFNDIVAIMEILKEEGHLDKVIDRDAIEKKKIRVEKYIQHSIDVGALKND